MSFTIIDVYRDNVPRGRFHPGSAITWDTGGNDNVIMAPATGKAIRISKLLLLDDVFTPVLGGVTPKLAQITYPSADGSSEITIDIDSMDELRQLITEVLTIGSDSYLVIKFDAPVWLMDSHTNKTFKVAFKGSSITSGSLILRPMGWQIDEANYQ